MPVDYDTAMAVSARGEIVAYTYRDTILYALGLGMGGDPLDLEQLPFVYEGREGPKVMPTMAVALVRSNTQKLGLDVSRVLHGEQRLTLHAAIPAKGAMITDTRTLSILDKGEGRGAVVNIETVGRLEAGGSPVFTLVKTLFARGDGGCGGPPGDPIPPHAMPQREHDVEHAITTQPDQALLYRLSGDFNPLHADPAVAKRAGFDRPILHGLCTYGIAARAILATLCSFDPTRIRALDARFTATVAPGDTIVTRMWVYNDVVSFRCLARERGVVVIDNGRCLLR